MDGSIPVRLDDQIVDYLKWAEVYVDQLDPLGPQSRHAEFTRRAGSYVQDIDRIKAAYGRLIGSEWPDAWKLGTKYVRDPAKPSYYAKSVFEVDTRNDEEDA